MKNNMEEIDLLIKETLSAEEAKFYDALEEQNIFQMIFGLFIGKNAWILIIMNIITVIAFGVFVYSCIQFCEVETPEELIRWGFCGFIALSMMCMLKVYSWMQMDKNAILREMKRLELQVMSLSGKVGE